MRYVFLLFVFHRILTFYDQLKQTYGHVHHLTELSGFTWTHEGGFGVTDDASEELKAAFASLCSVSIYICLFCRRQLIVIRAMSVPKLMLQRGGSIMCQCPP
jgi:hypothetical protein